jgi:hypothetical protein
MSTVSLSLKPVYGKEWKFFWPSWAGVFVTGTLIKPDSDCTRKGTRGYPFIWDLSERDDHYLTLQSPVLVLSELFACSTQNFPASISVVAIPPLHRWFLLSSLSTVLLGFEESIPFALCSQQPGSCDMGVKGIVWALSAGSKWRYPDQTQAIVVVDGSFKTAHFICWVIHHHGLYSQIIFGSSFIEL